MIFSFEFELKLTQELAFFRIFREIFLSDILFFLICHFLFLAKLNTKISDRIFRNDFCLRQRIFFYFFKINLLTVCEVKQINDAVLRRLDMKGMMMGETFFILERYKRKKKQ